MSWSGWYLRNSSISAILRSVIGVVTPFRWLVVLLLEGNAPVTFFVNHRPDSTGFYTLPGTLTGWPLAPTTEPVGLGGTSTYRPPHSADSRRGGGTGWDGARRYKPKTGKPRRTSGGSNGSKGGKPSMARSASSVQTENPSVRPLPNGLLVGP